MEDVKVRAEGLIRGDNEDVIGSLLVSYSTRLKLVCAVEFGVSGYSSF